MKKGIFWCTNHNSETPSLIIRAVECDMNGISLAEDIVYSSKSGDNFNHKLEWSRYNKEVSKSKKYNYYPRGRVEIKKSKVIIFLNPDINKETVIGKIIEEFDLEDVKDIRIVADGSKHYEYEIE